MKINARVFGNLKLAKIIDNLKLINEIILLNACFTIEK